MTDKSYSKALAPLAAWMDDPEVSEIMVNGYETVFIERQAKLVRVPTPFHDDEQVIEMINEVILPLGREVDENAPLVDARLFDGTRLNAVIPPVAVLGPSLTLRKFRGNPLSADDLVRFGTWSEEVAAFLEACVRARINIAIAGGTGSGKTTVLNILAGMIPADERIVTIENACELQLPQRRVVPLESRPPNREGKGEVSVRDLLLNGLHMRADRFVVGEVRASEAMDLLRAMNTGYEGCMFSLHANSPRDVLARLEMTVTTWSTPTVPLLSARQEIVSAVDLIVCVERVRDGSRKVVNVTEVQGMQGDIALLEDIFVYRHTGVREGRVTGYNTGTGTTPKFLPRIQQAGIQLPMEMFTPR